MIKYLCIGDSLRVTATEEKLFALELKGIAVARDTKKESVKWTNYGFYNSIENIFNKAFFYYLSGNLCGNTEEFSSIISIIKNKFLDFINKDTKLDISFNNQEDEYLKIGNFRLIRKDELNLALEEFRHVKPKQKKSKNGEALEESDRYTHYGYFPTTQVAWALNTALKEAKLKEKEIQNIKDILVELDESQKEILKESKKIEIK